MKEEKNKQKDARITIHTTLEQKELLKEYCQIYGCSVSDFVRIAIRRYIQVTSDS